MSQGSRLSKGKKGKRPRARGDGNMILWRWHDHSTLLGSRQYKSETAPSCLSDGRISSFSELAVKPSGFEQKWLDSSNQRILCSAADQV